jgi:hypothetical protein
MCSFHIDMGSILAGLEPASSDPLDVAMATVPGHQRERLNFFGVKIHIEPRSHFSNYYTAALELRSNLGHAALELSTNAPIPFSRTGL